MCVGCVVLLHPIENHCIQQKEAVLYVVLTKKITFQFVKM